MLTDTTILLFVIIVNLIALGMTWAAWKHPRWGRFLFGGMFICAGLFNFFYAVSDPEEFTYYADFAFLEGYRDFILGTFSRHLKVYLEIIAVTQVFVGFALWMKGRMVEIAALMAVVFLIAIVPLGFGAAFPAPVIMTIGAFLLYRHGASRSLPELWFKAFANEEGVAR